MDDRTLTALKKSIEHAMTDAEFIQSIVERKGCVNPVHLNWFTYGESEKWIRKGRMPVTRGEAMHNARARLQTKIDRWNATAVEKGKWA